MAKKILICLVGVSLVVFLVCCAKIPEQKAPPTPPPAILGTFGLEVMKLGDSIPLKWGDLIAVNNITPEWSRLWFQDKEGNVYVVWYNFSANKFREEYRSMKRR